MIDYTLRAASYFGIGLLTGATLWATAAHPSESYTLWTGGYWETAVVENDGGLYCRLSNNRPGIGNLHLTVDDDGWYKLFLFTENGTTVNGRQDTAVVIEMTSPGRRGDEWTLTGSNITEAGGILSIVFDFGYDPEQRAFVRDFMMHSELDLVDARGRSLINFSLIGSSAGVSALDECRQKIETPTF